MNRGVYQSVCGPEGVTSKTRLANGQQSEGTFTDKCHSSLIGVNKQFNTTMSRDGPVAKSTNYSRNALNKSQN